MAEQNIDVPRVKRLEFRIGIHVGDIIIADDDIFGDGVNIAVRLEGIAEPGGVCISNDAYRQVRGKVQIACDDMGSQILKNIAEPMQAWRVRTTGQLPSGAPPRALVSAPQALALPDKPSIAVLPLHNMSGDAEQQYLCDGLAEEIIIALSRIRALFVIARNSSFTYRGKEVDVRQIGRELGVRYVMQGSVRRAGNRLRIAGQLARAEMGARPSVRRKLSMRGSRSPKPAIRLPVLMRRATLDSVEGLRDRINHRVVAMCNLPSSIPLGQNE
jgi:TolB-like protein